MTAEGEALVLANLELPAKVVSSVLRTAALPRWVDREDLEGSGMVGLLQAATRYVPSGVPFQAFAWRRVHGAVLDHMRACAPMSRNAWNRAKADEALVRVKFMPEGEAANLPTYDTHPDFFADEGLWLAVEMLPPRLRRLVKEHYLEGRSVRAIVVEMGVGESRGSQLLKEAHRRLKEQLC